MNQSHSRDKIYKIVARQLGTDSTSLLKPQLELVSDLNIAPIDLVDLMTALEEEFHVEFPAEEVKLLVTLADLETLINEKMNDI